MLFVRVLAAACIGACSLVAQPTTAPPHEDTAEETQLAVCKIVTQEIETFANATMKRQLKGVCTTRQIDRRFRSLERRLLLELDRIKALLGTNAGQTTSTKTNDDYDYYNYDGKIAEKSLSGDEVVSVAESLTRDFSWIRTEVHKLNNTIHSSKGQRVYVYYWEVRQIRSLLKQRGIHVRSPDFYVLGHQLCVQIYPNYLDSQYLGMQLRPTSGFVKKHKFTILEPFDSGKDIHSQTLDGASGNGEVYRVPNVKLEERNYLHNNAITIKLTIFLNS